MLKKREVIHMHGIPIGSAEVIISDGGMVFISNFKVDTSQSNLALVTDQMTFDEIEVIKNFDLTPYEEEKN